MNTYTPRKRWPKIVVISAVAIVAVLAGGAGWSWYQDYQEGRLASIESFEECVEMAGEVIDGDPRQCEAGGETFAEADAEQEDSQLSMEERFVERYYEVLRDGMPGVDLVEDPPDITGNDQVDAYLREAAENRGYQLQARPNRDLKTVDNEKLQPETARAWGELQQAATEVGVSLDLVSGYRSEGTQAIIFDAALRERADEKQGSPFTAQQILDGEADEVIDDILSDSSIPGYSKHHTGHTIDVTDARSGATLEAFEETEAFEWLSDDAYANAREYGFLPSYPEGVDSIGPDPELWEFVWVGRDNTDF